MDESVIIEKLRSLRKRLKKVLLFEGEVRFIFWGALLSTVLLVILKLFGCDAPATWYSLLPLLAALLIPLGFYFFQEIPLIRVALMVDEKLQLKERLSTVLEWIEKTRKRTLMFKGLLTDAALNAQKINPEKLFTYRFSLKSKIIPIMLALIVYLAATPPWGILSPVLTREEKKNIQIAAKKVENSSAELEKNPLIKPEVKKEIKNRTGEIKKLARKPGQTDRKKAIAKISDLKDRLKEERKALARNKTLLDRLRGQDSPRPDRSNPGQGQSQSVSQKLREMSEQLKKKELSAEELKKMAEEIARMKDQLSPGSEMAKQLQKALSEMAGQNNEAASQTLSQLSKELKEMESQCAGEKSLGELSSQLDELKNALAGNSEMPPGEMSDSSSEST